MKLKLTKLERETLIDAIALAEVEWEDEDPRRKRALDRAWEKLRRVIDG